MPKRFTSKEITLSAESVVVLNVEYKFYTIVSNLTGEVLIKTPSQEEIEQWAKDNLELNAEQRRALPNLLGAAVARALRDPSTA